MNTWEVLIQEVYRDQINCWNDQMGVTEGGTGCLGCSNFYVFGKCGMDITFLMAGLADVYHHWILTLLAPFISLYKQQKEVYTPLGKLPGCMIHLLCQEEHLKEVNTQTKVHKKRQKESAFVIIHY